MAGTKISTMTALPNVNAVDSTFFPVVTAANENRKQTRRQNRRYLTTGTPVIGDVLRWSSNANAYNSAYTYERGDIVTSGGNLYVAVQQSSASNVQAPGVIAYWTEIGLATEIGDWVARPLTHEAPTDGQVPVWDTTLPIADWTATGTRWRLIDPSKYTNTGFANTYTLPCSVTTYFKVGLPIKFTISAVDYYAIITTVTGSTIAISGAPLTGTVTALYVGTPEMVHVERFVLPGGYGSSTPKTGPDYKLANTEADVDGGKYAAWCQWVKSTAYLVRFGATQRNPSGTPPKLTPVIGALGGSIDVVSTENTNLGIALSGTEGTWVYNALGTIDKDKYDIQPLQDLEIKFTAGSVSTMYSLNIVCVFVQE